MKKLLAVLLTLTLLVTLAAPAMAAEMTVFRCPACGGGAYEVDSETYTYRDEVEYCEESTDPHHHILIYTSIIAQCGECGTEFLASTILEHTMCYAPSAN